MPILILGGGTPSGPITLTWQASARTRRALTLDWQTWAATRRGPVDLTWTTSARTLVLLEVVLPPDPTPGPGDPPTESLSGGPLLRTSSSVSGLPGTVLTWEYTHSGASEELSVTVDGLYGLARPTATLSATARLDYRDGRTADLDALPARAFTQFGQEPEVNRGENTTTFRFKNSFDQRLRGERLPELIPWKRHPTPPASGANCAARPRQRQDVSALVDRVMRENVDGNFVLEDDPLRGAEWIEEERDFATENLTPQAVWDQTYGLLGMVLHVTPLGSGIRLVGRWPQPVRPAHSRPLPASLVLSRSDRREMLQTPASLTLRGAPFLTELTGATLMAWVGDDPAREEIERAVLPGGEWFEGPLAAETGQVRRGFRRFGGQIVAQVEFTTGDVEARETVDGQEVKRTFGGVLLGYKYTATEFDPDCGDRPILQRTETHAWGYTPFTQTSTFIVAGPGVYSAGQAGDLTASEVTITTFRYSPQGWLAARTTNSRKLASLQQQDAEDEPAKRGKLEAREYVTSMRTESWRPTGGGRWLYDPGTSGQALVSVYDKDSGEAIRTASLTRALPTPPELTDQAPPSYRCPNLCGKRVLDDTGVVLKAGDAGFAQETEISLPFLNPRDLEDVGKDVLRSQWWRVVSDIEVPYPVGTPVGAPWGGEGGVVREIRIQGSADGVTSSVTLAALDTLMPVAPVVSGVRAETTRGRSIMLAGRPGGARVRLVKGWDPGAGKPDTEDAFVAFRTGFPPGPGDEIEWELNRSTGQREAKSAST